MLKLSPENTERALADFRVFLYFLWIRLGLPAPTPVQYDIAHYLQHGPKRRIILAFRGVGKSWICSALVLWKLWKDLTLRNLVLSASKVRSDSFTTFTKRLLTDIEFLHHLEPDKAQGDRDSNIAFDVRGAPPHHAASVTSVGIYGQATGTRANVAILDDIEVPNNSETTTQREKLRARVAEIGGAVLSPDDKKGPTRDETKNSVIYLGTPQTEDSIYPYLAEEKGYDVRVWPSEVPEDAEIYKGHLAPMIQKMVDDGVAPGTPTDPERFDEMELAERKLEYGEAGYQLQYMLDTTLSDAQRYPLRVSDCIVTDVDVDVAPDKLVWGKSDELRLEALGNPGFLGDGFYKPFHVAKTFTPYSGSMMYIDPAGRGKDEVAFSVSKHLHGMVFFRRWGGLEDG